jgi:hypothetical protein
MRYKKEEIFTCIILLALIASFSIGSLSMREICTNSDDLPFSISNLSTQDIFWPGNSSEWMEVAPESQGLNSSKIAEMFEFIKDNRHDIHSIIVVRNGYLLVYEYLHHFEIYTDIYGTKTYFGGDNLHGQWSTSKSLMSILIGITLQKGLLDNANQTLYEFFAHRWSPSFINSTLKKNITIEQLLTMNSGIGAYYVPDKYDDDCISFILDEVPLKYTPGTEGAFVYSNGGVDLLSGIIANVTGTSTEEFAKQYLFEPLGISEDEYYWLNDSKGMDYGSYGIECTPKVQAKIGMLCLNNGTWNGEQIVDKDYMKDATSYQIVIPNWRDYGYLFYILDSPFEGYYTFGALGQCIYVIPEYNITVGFTGYHVDIYGGYVYEQIILDYILQFVEVPETGPNNPGIPGFETNLILLIIFYTSVVIIIRRKKINKNL